MAPALRGGAMSMLSAIAFAIACGDSQPPATESTISPPATVAPPTDVAQQPPTPASGAAGTAGPTQTPPARPVGAAGTGDGAAPGTPPMVTGVTYQRDIRPVLQSECVGCHVQGGIGPFPLDSWEAVMPVAATVVAAVSTHLMPPWPASDSCHELRDKPKLDDATRDVFAQWQAAGYPEGDPADYVPPAEVVRADLGPPTFVLQPDEAYTPPNNADDYHCFAIAAKFEQDTYLTALDIVPGVRSEVHHVQIHRAAPAQAANLQAVDQQSPGPGYPCLTGATVLTQNMFSYRPGSSRVEFAPGDAAYIEAGSALMIQVHYNTQFLMGQSPQPDKTKIELWTLPAGELPERIIYRTGATAAFNIPAGESHVVAQTTSPMSTVSAIGGVFVPGEIVGMTPHAHQIASRMTAELRPAGGDAQCLIDVPTWDFHWQLDYMYPDGVPYTAQDQLHVVCEYDNSAAHQPVVDGVRIAPRNVTWGEGSLDEMCLHYIWLRFDRDAFLNARRGGGLFGP